jgi:protein-disulfide isomerase
MNATHDRFDLAVPVMEADHMLGASHARVTLVEYGDFECPNCKQAAPVVKHLLHKHNGRLRVVFRHFPLEEVHPHAFGAALAAEAAGAQGKFWPMHDLMFENQGRLQARHLREYAQRLDLDMPRYDYEMSDEVYWQRVREDIEGGKRSGARSTPTFFVNGRIHDVSFGLERLEEGVEAALRT